MLYAFFLLPLATLAGSVAGVKRWRCTSEISEYTDYSCQILGDKPGCVYININFYSCAEMCNDVVHGSLKGEERCRRYCPDYYTSLGGCTLQEETTMKVVTINSTIMPSVKVIGTSTTADKPNDAAVLGIALGIVFTLLIVTVVALVICLCKNVKQYFRRLLGYLPCKKSKKDIEAQPDRQRHPSDIEAQPDRQRHSSAVEINQTIPQQEFGMGGICSDTNGYNHRPVSPPANSCLETTFTFSQSRDVNFDASRSTRVNCQPQNDDSSEAAANLLPDPR